MQVNGINITTQDIQRWDLPDPSLTLEDFQRIKSWGLDTIQVHHPWNLIEPTYGIYDSSYLAKLDNVLNMANQAGLKIIFKIVISQYFVDQGGWHSFQELWLNPDVQERFYLLWEFIVNRYKHLNVVAWNILNEPLPSSTSGPWSIEELQVLDTNWNLGGVSDNVIQRIRNIDNRTIIMTFGPWGSVINFEGKTPRPFSNITYSFSWYLPQEVTFRCGEWLDNETWIKDALSPVLNFRSTFNVPLLVQELGINASDCPLTESRLRWVQDSLNVLNKNRISWLYFIYAHWGGFAMSVLDENDNARPTVDIIIANIPSELGKIILSVALVAAIYKLIKK